MLDQIASCYIHYIHYQVLESVTVCYVGLPNPGFPDEAVHTQDF